MADFLEQAEVAVTEVPAGAQLIDVREPAEYAEVHAQGAKLIPMGELPARLAELDQDREIYVICKSGGRSQRIVDYLATQGISAINVAGGTTSWVAAGLPTA